MLNTRLPLLRLAGHTRAGHILLPTALISTISTSETMINTGVLDQVAWWTRRLLRNGRYRKCTIR